MGLSPPRPFAPASRAGLDVGPRRAAPAQAPLRGQAVDMVRGVAMVTMALDHIREFWSPLVGRAEDMAHASDALFFTRWVTHFCAPTFVLLSGVSIWLSARKYVSRARTSRFLLTRGCSW